MEGLGKTTLVKQVYDAAMVKNHFNSHAWLTVSESIRVEDLLKDMIQQLFSEIMQLVPFGVEIMSINKLKCLDKDFLQQRRYVVVFDDILCNRLIRLWTAEGFVNATNEKTIEEVVESCLNELFNRSLVQVARRGFSGKPYSFHIHNLMCEIILLKAIEKNIVQGLKVARKSSLPIDRKHIGKYRI
ncbi:disease resistance protein RPM1-like [Camellia sinensis]|uniref:disease resistance protein RPM1-like n=1 Tax=Camellia sinensis TaxID=4442 RepID=UPI001036A548|nr:disease resistance protein RPM1-like [Camellia sinensis]